MTAFKNTLMLLNLLCLMLLSKAIYAQTSPLKVAVSANFAPVLEQLIPAFEQQHLVKVQLIKGATGTLYQQIHHGAPFDVFLSADSIRPQRLIKENLAIATSLKTYAIGKLALWSAIDPHFDLKNLTANQHRLAIANPEIAPYGKAAKQALETLGLWQQYQGKLITGININQTFQQVRSKASHGGIVALSQLKLNQLQGFEIPTSYYQPIKQQLVILSSSKQQAAAKLFTDFLVTPKSQQTITALGYSVVEP